MEKSEFRKAQPTFPTDFLFLVYNNESTFHQQLHNVANIPLTYVVMDFIGHLLINHLFWTARTLSILVEIVCCITRDETQRLQTSVKFAAREKP